MPALDLNKLSGSLKKDLQPLYVIHGEEDLLRLESVDTIRAAARKFGYVKESHVADAMNFDWQELLAQSRSVSLFGEQKLLEIHIPTGKLGKQGGDALIDLAEHLPAETCVVVVLPKLERAQIQSKWFSTLAQHGNVLEAKVVDLNALPAWIKQRLQAQDLTIQPDALAWFAERVEGNLLAAKQEIDKLALLYPPHTELTLNDVEQSVANVARFDAFQLAAAWMSGDAKRVLHLLDGLQAEGDEPVLLLWAVAEDVRTLLRLTAALKQGKTVAAVRNELRLWGDKQTLAPKAVARLSPQKLIDALQQCAQIDRQIKGAETGDAWTNLKQLLLNLAA